MNAKEDSFSHPRFSLKQRNSVFLTLGPTAFSTPFHTHSFLFYLLLWSLFSVLSLPTSHPILVVLMKELFVFGIIATDSIGGKRNLEHSDLLCKPVLFNGGKCELVSIRATFLRTDVDQKLTSFLPAIYSSYFRSVIRSLFF